MRKPEWKQSNPADQIVAIVSAISGIASNMVEGVYTMDEVHKKAAKIEEYCEDLVVLAKMTPSTKW